MDPFEKTVVLASAFQSNHESNPTMSQGTVQKSDQEIIQWVLKGDVNSFEILLTRYKNWVFGVVAKHVPYEQVEEIAHEVFIKAYQALGSFRSQGEFRHWLSSIAVRTCYDFWRKRFRDREQPMSTFTGEDQREILEKIQSLPDLSETDRMEEAKNLLNWALDKLSPEDRMVVELVYLEGLSGKEAADLLGWSVTNVKIRSFRSKKKLQKLLEGVTDV